MGKSSVTGDPVGRSSTNTGEAEVTEEVGEAELTEEIGEAEVTEDVGNLVGRPSIEKGAFVGAGTGRFVTTAPADGLLGITRLTGFVVGLLTGFFEEVKASVGFLVGRRYCIVMAESFISCSFSGRH